MKTLYKNLLLVFLFLLGMPIMFLILMIHTTGVNGNFFYEFTLLIRINMIVFTLIVLGYLISQHNKETNESI
jgi:hypothetical protein